jgi:hypothetical protein
MHAFYVEGEATLQRIIQDEQGLARALNFTGSFGVIINSLGPSPRIRIDDWTPDTQNRFESRRKIEWDADDRLKAREARTAQARPSHIPAAAGPMPKELGDVSRVKHSDISVESIIREPLWDRATWRAIGWVVAEGVPPWMVLGFENGEAAAEILRQLVRDVGYDDPRNRLRITIVRNISKRHPSHYRVVIGSNVDTADVKKFAVTVFRVHTMTPDSSVNLDGFISGYNSVGSYLLGIGVVDPRKPRVPEPMRHGYVLKKTLQVREAWTIGLNDLDGAGILPDDDVLIPPDREGDAPVLELLQRKRERSHRNEWPSLKRSEAGSHEERRNSRGRLRRQKKGQRRRRK